MQAADGGDKVDGHEECGDEQEQVVDLGTPEFQEIIWFKGLPHIPAVVSIGQKKVPFEFTDSNGILNIRNAECILNKVKDDLRLMEAEETKRREDAHALELELHTARQEQLSKLTQTPGPKRSGSTRKLSSMKKKQRKRGKKRKETKVEVSIAGPVKPQYALYTLDWLAKCNGEKRSYPPLRKLETTQDFIQLAEDWSRTEDDRTQYSSVLWFQDLIGGLGANESELNARLTKVVAVLCDPNIHEWAANDMVKVADTLLNLPADGNFDTGLQSCALWALCANDRSCDAILKSMKEGGLLGICTILGNMNSLLSACPAKACARFLGAASCIASEWESKYPAKPLGSEHVHTTLVNVVRRANDATIVTTSLNILYYIFPAFFAKSPCRESHKCLLVNLISDIFASPEMILHDVMVNKELARCDMGSLLLASSVLTKCCLQTPQAHSSRMILNSGTSRRVFALAEWAYNALHMYQITQDPLLFGSLSVIQSKTCLQPFLDILAARTNDDSFVEMDMCRVALVQSVFILSVLLQGDWFDLRSFTSKSDSNKIFLEQVAELLLACTNMVREQSVLIEKEKNMQLAKLKRAAQEQAELEALHRLSEGKKNNDNEDEIVVGGTNNNGETKEVEDPEPLIPDHKDEWALRTIEVCSLRGLFNLSKASILDINWICNNLESSKTCIFNVSEAMSQPARCANINLIITMFKALESAHQTEKCAELAASIHVVLVTDLLLKYQREANISELLSCIARHVKEECPPEIPYNILTLIDHKIASLEEDDELASVALTFLFSALGNFSRFPSTMAMVGTPEGGSAVEVSLAAIGKLLSFQEKSQTVYAALQSATNSLMVILNNIGNVETFANVKGVKFICAYAEEFSQRVSGMRGSTAEKRNIYEIVIDLLSLLRRVIMIKSAVLQKAVLSAQVMDVLFSIACGGYEDADAGRWYWEASARMKRLATSILVALPFESSISEPCLIAIARKFICSEFDPKYSEVCMKQQMFGARMLSRMELSPNGHKLLRRSDVVKCLISFSTGSCQGAENLPASFLKTWFERRSNAILGLLYLCSDNEHSQEYICSQSLYRLLVQAWTSETAHDHALISALLQQFCKSKLNRTRIYKAEMRARSTASKWAKAKVDHDSTLLEAADKEEPEQVSVEEIQAEKELIEIMRLKKKYNKWLRKDLKVKKKVKVEQVNRRLPALKLKQKGKPVRQRFATCKEPNKSPLWKYRESILSPPHVSIEEEATTENIELVSTVLNPTLCRPLKSLWSGSSFGENLKKIKVHRGAESRPPWAQPIAESDPFRHLMASLPTADATNDLDVPSPDLSWEKLNVPCVMDIMEQDSVPSLLTNGGLIGDSNMDIFIVRPARLLEIPGIPSLELGKTQVEIPIPFFVLEDAEYKYHTPETLDQTCTSLRNRYCSTVIEAVPEHFVSSLPAQFEEFAWVLIPLYKYYVHKHGSIDEGLKALFDYLQIGKKQIKSDIENTLGTFIEVVLSRCFDNTPNEIDSLLEKLQLFSNERLFNIYSGVEMEVLSDNSIFLSKLENGWGDSREDWINSAYSALGADVVSMRDLELAADLAQVHTQDELTCLQAFLVHVADMIGIPSKTIAKAITGSSSDMHIYLTLRTNIGKDATAIGIDKYSEQLAHEEARFLSIDISPDLATKAGNGGVPSGSLTRKPPTSTLLTEFEPATIGQKLKFVLDRIRLYGVTKNPMEQEPNSIDKNEEIVKAFNKRYKSIPLVKAWLQVLRTHDFFSLVATPQTETHLFEYLKVFFPEISQQAAAQLFVLYKKANS